MYSIVGGAPEGGASRAKGKKKAAAAIRGGKFGRRADGTLRERSTSELWMLVDIEN